MDWSLEWTMNSKIENPSGQWNVLAVVVAVLVVCCLAFAGIVCWQLIRDYSMIDTSVS